MAKASSDGVGKIFGLCTVLCATVSIGWLIYRYKLRHMASRSALVSGYFVALVCSSWASCSIGMHVLNKVLMNTLHAPAIVSTAQMLVAVLVMAPIFGKGLFEVDGRALRCWLVVPVIFSAMLCTSCYSHQYISLSLITLVRNLTPLIVLPIETMVMPRERQPKTTPPVILALGITIAGTITYVGHVQQVSWLGVAVTVFNMVLAASDRLVQRYLLTGPCKTMPSGACTVVNNGLGMIPALSLALASNQLALVPSDIQSHTGFGDPRLLVLLLMSGFVGIGICYFGFEAQREMSATSFFVMQNMSKVLVVGAGVLLFDDPIRSPLSLFGLVLSLGGSFLYGWLQMAPPPAEAMPLLKAKGTPGTRLTLDGKPAEAAEKC